MQEFYCYNHKNISCMIKLLMKMDGNNNIKTKLNEISKWKFWNINGQNEITQNFKGQKCTLIFLKRNLSNHMRFCLYSSKIYSIYFCCGFWTSL